MPPKLSHDIQLTDENLWFLERYLNVFDFLELFPLDAVSNSDGAPGIPIRLHTDLGFVIESDVDRSKMQLRNRSKLHGWTRFTSEHNLQAGDTIRIEKTADRDFSLSLIRKT
ncbi:MAG: hypothetical protein H6506_02005 [Calditrichaeota bacterium]|nr:hypothetical protein [Calditrichota bacterium]MCB9391406.1 hypothetical protein [Calditrichota bacterium]